MYPMGLVGGTFLAATLTFLTTSVCMHACGYESVKRQKTACLLTSPHI